jgi:phosphatidylserine/phosphatidylglycerophosphate/cardiolipin synthase-like enzyme
VASVLEAVKPLANLVAQAADAHVVYNELAALARSGAHGSALTQYLATQVSDRNLAGEVLTYAGVLDNSGAVKPEAVVRIGQAEVLAEAEEATGWQLVLTVPSFLRRPLADLVRTYGAAARPRETTQVLKEVADAARQRLVIAAPYLQTGFVTIVIPAVQRLLSEGGEVMVVTRALSLRSPEMSSANTEAVALLREAGARTGREPVVRSWEESGLGVHFKVAIADGRLAYLGSANFTLAGTAGHAEIGVVLNGQRVATLARWVDIVADTLAARRLPAG